MRNKISEEIKLKILELNKQNKNTKEIGDILKISDKTVQRYLKSEGLNFLSVNVFIEKRTCLFCEKTYEIKRYLKNKFCSRSCSCAYNNYKRDKKNKSEKDIKILKSLKEIENVKKLNTFNLSLSEKIKKCWNDKLMKENFDDLKWDRKRNRVILEQDGKCNKCGNGEWLGIPLSLEIDHKDGNNENDNRENLEGLCPNCHSITDTWRGRNKKSKTRIEKITPENFVQAYKNNNGNIRQALIELNLSPKGGNYARMYKFLRMENIIAT